MRVIMQIIKWRKVKTWNPCRENKQIEAHDAREMMNNEVRSEMQPKSIGGGKHRVCAVPRVLRQPAILLLPEGTPFLECIKMCRCNWSTSGIKMGTWTCMLFNVRIACAGFRITDWPLNLTFNDNGLFALQSYGHRLYAIGAPEYANFKAGLRAAELYALLLTEAQFKQERQQTKCKFDINRFTAFLPNSISRIIWSNPDILPGSN